MEVVMPRIVLAEFNTHRMFSRNSASSRAIPVEKMIRMVQDHPYVPTHWGRDQRGMQANEEVDKSVAETCAWNWHLARDCAVAYAQKLTDAGIHKQITNRLLEPFMWHTVIVTATEWSNFFHLRNHSAAHPDIHKVAGLMQEQYESHAPEKLDYGQWHLPYVTDEEKKNETDEVLVNASVMRCARVSFLRHDGVKDTKADAEACVKQLLTPGHMSPLEHPAVVPNIGTIQLWFGNFCGWIQYRKTIMGEKDILGFRKQQG
jgi:thymidylate synthase ThyX